MKGKNRFSSALAGASIAVLLTLAGCADREAQQQSRRTQELLSDPTVPVTVQPALTQSIQQNLTITGELTTAEDVAVGAKQAGRITAVYIKDGDTVRANQVIALQDSSDLASRVRQAQAQVSSAQAALSQATRNASIAPSRSAAAVAAAEAQVRQARAQLQKVRAGARDEEKLQAEAALSAAKSNLDTAKRELDRTRELHDAGAVSRQRLDQAENAYQNALAQFQSAQQAVRLTQQASRPEDISMAEEQVRQAEEGVRQARAQQRLDVTFDDQVAAARANLDAARAQLEMARQALADTQIRSPFGGKVSGNPAQPGTFAGPGTIVARIIGGSGAYFEGDVPEGSIGEIQPGMPVRVRLDALPDRILTGSVAAISPVGDQIGRLFKIRIQLGGNLESLRPGMFARGEINLRTVANALVVPTSAVLRRGEQDYVFIIEGSKARRVAVTTGLRSNGKIQVEGLTPGDQVVVEGQTQLEDGTVVKIETATPAARNEAVAGA
jgi:HlyD family secretion protein